MSFNSRSAAPLCALLALTALAACEGEADPTGPTDGAPSLTLNEVVTVGPLNASNTDSLVYFSLTAGQLVSVTEPWELALRRFELRLNSAAIGGSADASVTGYGVANAATATDAEVLAFSPQNTAAAFDAFREAQIPDDSLFVTDRLAENRQGMFTFGGVPVANSGNYWKVRLANGEHALVRASRLTFTPQFAVDTLYLEFRLQAGATLGDVQELAIAPGRAVTSISLADNQVVEPDDECNWDLRFDPAANQLAITTNTGCDAGTYPGATSPTFLGATRADDAPQYAGFLSELVGPIPNSVFDPQAPFRYNLAGNDRLSPTFNIFLVKSGDRVYKLQVIDYYSDTGVAGFPTLRYARIR
jgi:hypothetical protein